ncbi:MAG: polysaccharide deacetylase and domain protein [Bacteroidetes bacterium]|nr:polysaccharide deacetylase and domain protein [Bacteroidota bacterium]
MPDTNNIFLFSIDLEDVREGVVNGSLYKDRVVNNTLKYLDWLEKNNSTCTFFTVGKVAEKYPDLIKQIVRAGHEIACHSYSHTPLNLQTPESFKFDLEKNINALLKSGVESVKGFRAPVFSLTKDTSWAHEILAGCGITYSSSVLPADNPLYGWKEFGAAPKQINKKLIELPVTLNRFGPLNIPFAGGVYFRSFPFWFIRKSFKKYFKNNEPVLSYFHPYDLDSEQEKFMHAGINNSTLYNFLMYYNRKHMLSRLDKVVALDVKIMRYDDYIKNHLKNGV